MMSRLNTRIVKWLEEGNLREALLGDRQFFLADHTYRAEHDILLVMDVLLEWAHMVDEVQAVGEEFCHILLDLAETMPKKCAHIVLAYAIASRDLKKTLPCDFAEILDRVEKNIQTGGNGSDMQALPPELIKSLRKDLGLY